jgi:hypothetical protein
MKGLARQAAVAFLAMTLAACSLELAKPESAAVERYEKGSPVSTWVLTEKQLASFATWFAQHQSGWSPSYATYVPRVLVRVKYDGGKEGSVNIFPSGFVIVSSRDGQFTQTFEAKVVNELIDSIGAQ